MDNEEFYLNSDPDYLVSAFESEINFTSRNWFYPGRPTMVIVLTHALLGTLRGQIHDSAISEARPNNSPIPGNTTDRSKKNLLNFLNNLRCGECNGVRIRLCRLTESVTTSNIESLDFLINQPDMNWESILRVAHRTAHYRRTASIHRKLGYNESETQANTPGGHRTPGSKTPKRRSTTFQGKSLASPLDRLNQESYFEEISQALSKLETNAEPRFKLKDPEDSPVPSAARKALSHADNTASVSCNGQESQLTESPAATDMMSLVLGDPSQFSQAVESLVASVNLYDQIGEL